MMLSTITSLAYTLLSISPGSVIGIGYSHSCVWPTLQGTKIGANFTASYNVIINVTMTEEFDAVFGYFVSKNRSILPDWFTEAISIS